VVALFWVCAMLLLLNWAIYPLALYLMSRFVRQPVFRDPETWPPVSVLISARNEEAFIAARLSNLLESDYAGPLEILVGSDVSEDATDSIVSGFSADNRVMLFRSEGRVGKSHMLQLLAERASGEIFVFTDGDTIFRPDTLTELVRPFTDPAVGMVDGNRRNSLEDETCESVYWKYEKWIRAQLSRLGTVLGATGAVYALRRSSFHPLGIQRSDDFELGVMVRMTGWRAVFNPGAVAVEPAPDDYRQFQRMARIISWMCSSGVIMFFMALGRGRIGLALQLFVHKFIRWVTAILLVLLTISAGVLWAIPFYRIIFLLLTAFHVLAAAGLALRDVLPGKLLFPFYFWLMSLSTAWGVIRAIAGRPSRTWERSEEMKA